MRHRLLPVALAGLGAVQTTTFPMAGSWAQNRGNLIDLPISGDKPCAIHPEANPPFVMGNFGQPVRGAAAGCIPGSGTVMVSGPLVAPRSFMLTGVTRNGTGAAPFSQTGASQNAAAFPAVPHIVQLATSYTLRGPGSASVTTPYRPTPFPSGKPTGTFMKSAFLTQTGRTGPDFGWCPGGATQNPNCTTPTASLNGATRDYNGIVRYTAGPNAFGGTMTMLVQGTGSITFKHPPGPSGSRASSTFPSAPPSAPSGPSTPEGNSRTRRSTPSRTAR